ncbi:methyltransferase-like protein 27 [Amphibalanus amphitrite]|uniref:methyltransferase-like protein 27 n=1 Tax=Amphibalanus amphitrite TaxID=1232801 RepID=UPI001C924A07|nr:methyltransferase-like protein 27 [Amphibalanus amphitrite]
MPSGGQEEPRLVNQLIQHRDVQETVTAYNRTATNYDEEFPVEVLGGPRFATEAVLDLFPEDGAVPRGQLKVLDVAAGTGLVGQRLYDAGIRNLDALEPSSEMIKIAQSRGIYQRIIEDVIGHHRIDVEDNTYDLVVVAGAFVPGHCPLTALDEMIRVCKPGGYIINSMRLEFLFISKDYTGLLDYQKALEERGLWRRVSHIIVDRYFETVKQGITFVYQKI